MLSINCTLFYYFPGQLGCSVSVLSFMDKICSGKSSCEYVVGSKGLDTMQPCSSQDVKAYLETDYECIKGKIESLHALTIGSLHVRLY